MLNHDQEQTWKLKSFLGFALARYQDQFFFEPPKKKDRMTDENTNILANHTVFLNKNTWQEMPILGRLKGQIMHI